MIAKIILGALADTVVTGGCLLVGLLLLRPASDTPVFIGVIAGATIAGGAKIGDRLGRKISEWGDER